MLVLERQVWLCHGICMSVMRQKEEVAEVWEGQVQAGARRGAAGGMARRRGRHGARHEQQVQKKKKGMARRRWTWKKAREKRAYEKTMAARGERAGAARPARYGARGGAP